MFSTFGAPIIETFESSNSEKDNLEVCPETKCFISTDNDGTKTPHMRKSGNTDYETCEKLGCSIEGDLVKCPASVLNPGSNKQTVSVSVSSDDGLSTTSSSSGESSEESDSDSDPEEKEAVKEENSTSNNSSRIITRTTSVKNNEEETDSEESEEPESTSVVDENGEDKDESEEEGNTDTDDESENSVPAPTTAEGFYGGSNIEHFSNKNGFTMSSIFSVNLLLKSVMIACLFYVLAHPDTKKYLLGRVFKNIKPENYLYVAMLLFLIIFYVIGIFL